MTKIWPFLIMIFILSATSSTAQSKPLRVVASASMIADIAREISGDKLEIKMIVPIGGDPHLYEPTPKDAQLVNSANLILVNGLTFEGWIGELIDNSGTSAETVTVTEGIDVLVSPTYANSTDPHAWMSAFNGIIYAENIHSAFCRLDPPNAPAFTANLEKYRSKLQELDDYIMERIRSIPAPQRVLITSHDAFQYYGKRYGIRLEAIMGISTEAEAQTSDVIRVSQAIKEYSIPAIFIESTINPKLMEQLASDNNVAIGGKLFADSLGDKNSPANTYINMLTYNTNTIVDALTGVKILKKAESKSPLVPYLIIGLISISILVTVLIKVNK